MATPSEILLYLRGCYESDNRETGIPNLFHTKFKHVTFLTGVEDLLTGLLPRVPIDPEIAFQAKKEASFYKKDKTLYYCAFPLVGRVDRGIRLPRQLCAPLFFFPADIVEADGTTYLEIDLAQDSLNIPVLSTLAGSGEAPRLMLEDLLSQIPRPPFGQGDSYVIASLLADFLPNTETKYLTQYPKLLSEKGVRKLLNRAKGQAETKLHCLSAAAMALIPNSPNTRGVFYELKAMAEAAHLSNPARILLTNQYPTEFEAASPIVKSRPRVPAILSHSQQNVLNSAASVPLTLVIGPPGTGKSYTIAALALDHLSRGESVLIASRMNHAVDIVGEKIDSLLGPSHNVIRAGRKKYLRELKKHLEHILRGLSHSPHEANQTQRKLQQNERELAETEREIQRIEEQAQHRVYWEQQWGDHQVRPADGLWNQLLHPWRSWYLNWRIKRALPFWQCIDDYQQLLGKRSRLISETLRLSVASQLHYVLQNYRKELRHFLSAIRARTDARQEKLFSQIDLQLLLQTFPIWLVAVNEIAEILPLERELFDLAIIDEATQCDMATCMPIFQRARRVAIVGDPNQLRHVSFLSFERQDLTAERYGLDDSQRQRYQYRQKSVLDLMDETIPTQNHVFFLDEHFRSMPQIIDFSNQQFYAAALKVMTLRPETANLQCVWLHHLSHGKKQKSVNPAEAEALVEAVAQKVEDQADLPPSLSETIGILSPFRDQVDFIFSLLQARLPLRVIEKHEVMVGTAHTFQGEERDVMYLSLVVDSEAHPASFNFLNIPNVFNVAITRARNAQHIFCSVPPEEAQKDSLLQRYLFSIRKGLVTSSVEKHSSDRFLRELTEELEQRGFHIWPVYPVAGVNIDLVAERQEQTLGIDLVGYPGDLSGMLDLERYRLLQRAGLRVLPLPYSAWCRERNHCLRAIETRFS
ncbi:MAG: DEAD/DEAH box helicase [Gemmataceae bacterium]